jgi:hypothetical protein
VDPFRPGVNLRSDLLAAGLSERELRLLRRTGLIATVRPGAYVVAPVRSDDALVAAVARHRLAVIAAAQQLGAGVVFSHVSAAVMHGLPLWATPLDRVHGTRHRRSGGSLSRHLHLHAAALDPDEIVVIDGVLVTSVARTLADLARFLAFEHALVPADAALHRHRVTRAELDVALDRAVRRPGNAAARRVLAFARPGADSPGESRSRLAIHHAGLPDPVLQHEVCVSDGRVLGQVDFWWEEFGTAGEFDGRVKYGRLLRPGQDPGEVVFAEKVREDAIRGDGHGMVRWTWPEIAPFDGVARRLRTVFDRPRR